MPLSEQTKCSMRATRDARYNQQTGSVSEHGAAQHQANPDAELGLFSRQAPHRPRDPETVIGSTIGHALPAHVSLLAPGDMSRDRVTFS